MKGLFFFLAFFIMGREAAAQVSGRLVTVAGQPVASANVLLLKSGDSMLVKAVLTDEKGGYQIGVVLPGRYFLRCTGMGYQRWDSPVFSLTAAVPGKDLGTQPMREDGKELAAFVLRGEKPLYQQQPEGITVNVESSPLTKGSSALEVLQRSPGVLINLRDNSISLNGKSGVMVMIDGKLLRMSLEQLVNFLSSMSADDIERIELLTTPPSRYDAEGSAGLINIVLKKNKKPGTSGAFSLTGGYGWREKEVASINLAHNTAATGWYGSYIYSHDKTKSDLYNAGSQDFPVLGGKMDFVFTNVTTSVRDNQDVTIGMDVKADPKTMLGASVSYSYSHSSTMGVNRSDYTILPDSVLAFNGHIQGENAWKNLVTSVYADRTLGKGGKLSLSVDGLYYTNENPADLTSTFLNDKGEPAGGNDSVFSNRQTDFAHTAIRVVVGKVDYSEQLSGTVKLETGVKATYTKDASLSGIQYLVNGSWLSRPETSNDIDMKERIGAAYASVNMEINPSTRLVMGVRYEYAFTKLVNEKTGESNVDRRQGVLFPTLFFSRKLSEATGLQLSYTKRIGRPSYNDLASFAGSNDPIAVFTGNPQLQPTVSNTAKLGLNYRKYSWSFSLSREDKPIARWQLTESPAGNLLYVAPQNLRYINSAVFQSSLPLRILGWWNMTLGAVGGWSQFSLDYTRVPVTKTIFGYSFNVSESFILPAGWSAELSGWYSARSYNGSTEMEACGAVNAGIRKELSNNKGIFQLSAADIFRVMNFRGYYGKATEEAFHSRSYFRYSPETPRASIIRLTYTRSFGSGGIGGRKEKTDGSADEKERVRK